MEIFIHSKELAVSQPLKDRIEHKITKLFAAYPFVRNAEVNLKSDAQTKTINRVMEIQINVLKGKFSAETRDINLFKALDKNMNKLKRQLEKYKQKQCTNP